MALSACRECGKQVSDEAAKCPHCGVAKPIKHTSRLTLLIGGFFIIFVGMQVANHVKREAVPPPTPPPQKTAEQIAEEKAMQKRKDAQVASVMGAMRGIKSGLRDPNSVEWDTVLANDDGSVICIIYRARNGFGGMNVDRFVMDPKRVSRDAAHWNQRCTKNEMHVLVDAK